MKRNYRVGSKFKLTANAVENYGERYANKVYTVRAWFDHYHASGNILDDPHGHPGFDASAESALYEAHGLNFALYEWEMEGL